MSIQTPETQSAAAAESGAAESGAAESGAAGTPFDARLAAAAGRGSYRGLVAEAEAAIAAAPEDEAARLRLAQALFQAGDLAGAQPQADWVTRFAQDWERRAAAWSVSVAAAPYLPDIDVLDLRALAQRWSGHLMARRLGRQVPPPLPRPAGRPLRVGYLLAELPAGCGFLPPGAHDGTRIAAQAYWRGTGPAPEPALQDLSQLAAPDAAAQIRQDDLDILLDLCPAGGEASDMVMLLRPARVQIGWINRLMPDYDAGHDWLLGDTVLFGGSDFAPEEGVRRHALAQPVLPFALPDVPVRPASARTAGQLTLGALPDAALADSRSLQLWAEILLRLPGARFVLAASRITDLAAERILGAFAGRGIPLDRISLSAGRDRMRVLANADLLLDGRISGTAVDALTACRAGVPVVAACGDRQIARRTAGILTAIGHDELVADGESGDGAALLQLAAAMAGAPERLARYRTELPAAVERSGLADAARNMARLEEALTAIWRTVVQGARS